MRKILFRGERVDNGEWIYGYYIKATHHWHNHGIHEDWIATDTVQNGGWCNVRGKYAVIPKTVGQYTGLTDKNGTKIFEGDILKTVKGVGYVVYGKGCFCVQYEGQNKPAIDIVIHYGDVSVIGNIHDNPELLKGE